MDKINRNWKQDRDEAIDSIMDIATECGVTREELEYIFDGMLLKGHRDTSKMVSSLKHWLPSIKKAADSVKRSQLTMTGKPINDK